jgi:hypothetical protein
MNGNRRLATSAAASTTNLSLMNELGHVTRFDERRLSVSSVNDQNHDPKWRQC